MRGRLVKGYEEQRLGMASCYARIWKGNVNFRFDRDAALAAPIKALSLLKCVWNCTK